MSNVKGLIVKSNLKKRYWKFRFAQIEKKGLKVLFEDLSDKMCY